jgi:hypothetical protein
VALILNLTTGHVSPQYHVVYDDDFLTVGALLKGHVPDNWEFLCKAQLELDYPTNPEKIDHWDTNSSPENEFLPLNSPADPLPSSPTPNTVPPLTSLHKNAENEGDVSDQNEGEIDENEGAKNDSNEGDQTISFNLPPILRPPSSVNEGEKSDSAPSLLAPDRPTGPSLPERPINLEEAGLRRSQRTRTKTSRLLTTCLLTLYQVGAPLPDVLPNPVAFVAKHFNRTKLLDINGDGTENNEDPRAFTTVITGNDTFNYKDMLQQPDVTDFLRAMLDEVNDHTERGHWNLVPRDTIGTQRTISAVWSFKRKRLPDGTLVKHKARLCANGSQQVHGVT